MRRSGRTDGPQKSVVSALRAAGWSVVVTSSIGGGWPDLAVSRAGRTVLIEVKRDKKAKLTPAQELFRARWQGEFYVVTTPQEAIDAVSR